jgi:hypothetical protein
MKVPMQAISNKEKPFIQCKNGPLALSVAVNKDIYWFFVSKKVTEPIAVNKWCTELGIDKADWTNIYKTYATLQDTKLKSFQFKIINNILPCNLYLNRIKRSDTDKCPTCNKLDDLNHYLMKCDETATIWRQLTRWWQGLTNQEIVLNIADIIIGLTKRTENIIMRDQLNDIIMTSKWKIHANKQQKEVTCFYQILHNIKNMLNIQKFIANKNHTLHKYEQKWGEVEDYLT